MMEASTPPAPWGAIFDWDGVVTASEELHNRVWMDIAAEDGRTLPENYFERTLGLRNEDIIPGILDWATTPGEIQRLAERKESGYRKLVRSEGIEPLPGVVEWLRRLAEAGIPRVVGSSTPRANIECALEVMGLEPPFHDIVAAEDVSRGKPHPEVFRICGDRLGIREGRGVVFEDAPAGIEAGLAAGFHVVAVSTSRSPDELQRAHRVVQRLDELDVDELSAWFTP